MRSSRVLVIFYRDSEIFYLKFVKGNFDYFFVMTSRSCALKKHVLILGFFPTSENKVGSISGFPIRSINDFPTFPFSVKLLPVVLLRYQRKDNFFAILMMCFIFQMVAYHVLWKRSKIGTRLKEKAHHETLTRKSFPHSISPGTCYLRKRGLPLDIRLGASELCVKILKENFEKEIGYIANG